MNAIIISIGDELLSGRTVNTNASWIGETLTGMGHRVLRVDTLPDDRGEIQNGIDLAVRRADFVIVTGGLGPTDDDKTREAICELLGCGLREDPGQREVIERIYREANRELNDRSARQAMVPDLVEAIPNRWGTAPGMTFRHGNAQLFVLPGVPSEMRSLMMEAVAPRIGSAPGFEEQVYLLYGIPESELAIALEDVEKLSDDDLCLAYLPSDGTIRLRLIRKSDDGSVLERFERMRRMIEEIAAKWIVSDRNESLASAAGRTLRDRGETVVTAESCTGGLIGAALTDVPGSSAYYLGGFVCYANEAKGALLDVPQSVIETDGAVSEGVALAMAEAARARLGADYAISATGIAGPDGGRPEKPVGTVWIGIASPDGVTARRYHFNGDRSVVRQRTVNAGLAGLIETIESL